MTTERRPNVDTGTTTWKGWRVEVDWQVIGSVPTPVALRLEPLTAVPEPLTSTLLRELPFGQLARETRRAVSAEIQALTQDLVDSAEGAPTLAKYVRDRGDAMAAPFDGSRSAGRDLGDALYREVAAVYSAAAPHSPTKAVREHYGITDSAAARRVGEARRRGYLPKTTRGRVGPITKEKP